MAEIWPATLQDKLNEAGFSHTPGKVTERSEMDIGPAKLRRRFTKPVSRYSATIELERDLYNDLYNFYYTTLAGGVKTFDFDHPITGVPAEFRFLEEPTISPLGGTYFRVQMTWEQIP